MMLMCLVFQRSMFEFTFSFVRDLGLDTFVARARFEIESAEYRIIIISHIINYNRITSLCFHDSYFECILDKQSSSLDYSPSITCQFLITVSSKKKQAWNDLIMRKVLHTTTNKGYLPQFDYLNLIFPTSAYIICIIALRHQPSTCKVLLISYS